MPLEVLQLALRAALGGMGVTTTAIASEKENDSDKADAECAKKFVSNNEQYVAGEALHDPTFQGAQPIHPAERLAVVTCMDARIDVEDALGIQTGTLTSFEMREVWWMKVRSEASSSPITC